MTRLAAAFGKPDKALVAYLTVGYPDLDASLETARHLAAGGADVIELGIPFSDPLADGATIQQASFRALEQGVTVATCLELAARLRREMETPLVFMTYYNPVLSFGVDRFCHEAAASGVDGLIVVDMPPEEGDDVDKAALKEALAPVYLLAPNSTAERIKLVAQKSRGFIYLVSVTGVTGARNQLPSYLEEFVSGVREETKLPLCVGFGMSSPSTAWRAARVADGVIVGSRLVQLLGGNEWEELEDLVKELRRTLDSPD